MLRMLVAVGSVDGEVGDAHLLGLREWPLQLQMLGLGVAAVVINIGAGGGCHGSLRWR